MNNHVTEFFNLKQTNKRIKQTIGHLIEYLLNKSHLLFILIIIIIMINIYIYIALF